MAYRPELPLPQPAKICDGLIRAAARRPDAEALVCGSRRQTYGGLLRRVAQLATVLREAGLRTGDRAAMLSRNSDRYVEFYFGAIWAGGIMVPLNQRLSESELLYLFDDCLPKVLLFDDDSAEQAQAIKAKHPSVSLIAVGQSTMGKNYEVLLSAAEPGVDMSGSDHDTAVIVYTGGTTGKPRGVMLSHRNVVSNSLSTIPYLQLDQSTTQLHVGPFFHVGAGQRIFSATDAGARHVVLPRFSVEEVLRTIEIEGVTSTVLVPTMMHRILKHPRLDDFDLSRLRYISYGAAPMPPDLLKAFMTRFDHCVVCQSYGQTECAPVATALEHRDHLASGPYGDKSNTIGYAVSNVEVLIADRDGDPMPTGNIGEIIVRGPNVMAGYWNNPRETASVLKAGWLYTGDLGFMDQDGFVTLVDRAKDMVISGGENVYSVEVERVLVELDEVIAAAVIGVPDVDLGERVHAVVRHHPGQPIDLDTLQAHCRTRLAGYKIPRSMDLITSPLPVTAANKIDKRALKQRQR